MVHIVVKEQLSFKEGLDFWRDHKRCRKELIARDLRKVINVLAADQGVSPEAIRRPKGHPLRRLRLVAIYLNSVHYAHEICTTAKLLGLSPQVGTYTGQNIEDRRDDREFDRWLDEMESRLEQADEQAEWAAA